MQPTNLIKKAPERFEMRLRVGNTSLSLHRDVDQERNRQARVSKAADESTSRGTETIHRGLVASLLEIGLVEDFTSKKLAPAKTIHLSIRQICERLDPRHTSNNFAEDDEIFRIPRNELVDEVLEYDRKGG